MNCQSGTNSFVNLSVRIEQLGSQWMDFHQISYFSKIYHGNSSLIKIRKEKRVLYMKTNIRLWSYLGQFISERCKFEKWPTDSAQKMTLFRSWMSDEWVWRSSVPPVTSVEINKHKIFDANNAWITDLYFQKPPKDNLSNLPHQTVEKLPKKKKTHGVLRGPQLGKQRWRARLGTWRVKRCVIWSTCHLPALHTDPGGCLLAWVGKTCGLEKNSLNNYKFPINYVINKPESDIKINTTYRSFLYKSDACNKYPPFDRAV